MEELRAIEVLSALAHPTRMQALRRLVSGGAAGVSAGALARAMDLPQSTLSAHLAILVAARLASSARRSRSIIYRAELATLGQALSFVVIDCCARHPAVCVALTDVLRPPPGSPGSDPSAAPAAER